VILCIELYILMDNALTLRAVANRNSDLVAPHEPIELKLKLEFIVSPFYRFPGLKFDMPILAKNFKRYWGDVKLMTSIIGVCNLENDVSFNFSQWETIFG
jgi:hypothetical protein